jgi:hypothetical protein
LLPEGVNKELAPLYKPYENFMDKVNEMKQEITRNPTLGENFTGKFIDGKKDGFGVY